VSLESLESLTLSINWPRNSLDCPTTQHEWLARSLQGMQRLRFLAIRMIPACVHEVASLRWLANGLACVAPTLRHLSLGLLDAHGTRPFEQRSVVHDNMADMLFPPFQAPFRLTTLRLQNFHLPAHFFTSGGFDLGVLRALDLPGCSFPEDIWREFSSFHNLELLHSIDYSLISFEMVEFLATQSGLRSVMFTDMTDLPWSPADLRSHRIPSTKQVVASGLAPLPNLTQLAVPNSMHCHDTGALDDLLPCLQSVKCLSMSMDFNDHVRRIPPLPPTMLTVPKDVRRHFSYRRIEQAYATRESEHRHHICG